MLFAFFPFLFLFLPILVWLWKLTSGEDKARLSVLLLGASLLFGACQGLEALLPGGLLEPRLLLPLLAVCAVIVWALPCSQHVMLGRADGSRPWLHWQPNLLWAVALALPALASLLLMQGHAFLSFRF